MKFLLESDFLYTSTRNGAVIVVKSCGKNCAFCPASALVNFQDFQKLGAEYDYSQDILKLFGDITSPNLITFLKKVREYNPRVEIHVESCMCKLPREEMAEYSHIISYELKSIFESVPDRFVIPATGDEASVTAVRARYASRHPNIPIVVKSMDSGNPETVFWAESKIAEFNSKVGEERTSPKQID
jgi:hypothetical protein